MNKGKKLNKTNRSGASLLHLFAALNQLKSGPVKFRRKKMKFKWLSYAIVSMAIYIMWTMFFILSQFNASIFISLINKIAVRIVNGY